MQFGCSIGIFLNSAHLICPSTDISQCFRGSLRLRDNESRLYVLEDVFASGTLTRNVVRVRALLRPVKYTEIATHAKGGNRNTTKKSLFSNIDLS